MVAKKKVWINEGILSLNRRCSTKCQSEILPLSNGLGPGRERSMADEGE
uniref:Uncharacterized protein n=1 Tax=Lotus japonicus TaxID=34305 RepID=I3RZR3_LOTJA|nr:unknown [Lotus japonicus]